MPDQFRTTHRQTKQVALAEFEEPVAAYPILQREAKRVPSAEFEEPVAACPILQRQAKRVPLTGFEEAVAVRLILQRRTERVPLAGFEELAAACPILQLIGPMGASMMMPEKVLSLVQPESTDPFPACRSGRSAESAHGSPVA